MTVVWSTCQSVGVSAGQSHLVYFTFTRSIFFGPLILFLPIQKALPKGYHNYGFVIRSGTTRSLGLVLHSILHQIPTSCLNCLGTTKHVLGTV